MGTRRGPSVVWSPWGYSVNLGFLLRSELLVFEVRSYISCAARKGDLRDFLLSLAFISCDISDMTEFILLGLWWISWPYVIKRVIFSHWFLFSFLLLLFSRDSASFLFITFFFSTLRAWSLFTFLYIGCSCNSELLLSSSNGLFSLLLCFNSRISGI